MPSNIQPGDLVAIPNRRGVWVVMRRRDDLAIRKPDSSIEYFDLRRCGEKPEALSIAVGPSALIVRPTLEYGQHVDHHGNRAAVVSDDGDTVRVSYQTREALTADGKTHTRLDWNVEADRAELIHSNYRQFV